MIRLAVVDDHPAILAAVIHGATSRPGIEVVGRAMAIANDGTGLDPATAADACARAVAASPT